MPASRTAEYVALYRALESTERRRAPLFHDPLASSFLTGGRSLALGVANMPGLRGLLERYADWRAPGARTSAIGRTRFIDDVVRAEVAAGTRQIVILGAGYDSRAHRLSELATVRVYEVDRADTQAEKQRRLELVEGKRKDIRYVAVDFERQHLPSELADAGWRSDQRSLFIWEGVTNYIDESAVGAVLDMVGHAARDTAIVFTYIHRGVIDGTTHFVGADKLVASVRRLGEPWRTGFVPDELPQFVAALGLQIEQDLGADDYRARYFSSDTRTPGYAFYRIAVARARKP